MLHTVSSNANKEWSDDNGDVMDWKNGLSTNKMQMKHEYEQCQINQNEGYIQYLQMFFGQHSCTFEAGPKKNKTVKTQDLFFFLFTEPLIYDEMGDMSALISERHAQITVTHTRLRKKANHKLPKKRACVVCPVSKIQ